MRIGAQLYTIRDFTQTPEDIEASLRKIKAMGFDLIQISGFGPCDINLLAGWVKEIGLEVCVTHSPWKRIADPAQLPKLIDEHKKLNCSFLGIGSKPDDYPNSYEGYTAFIKKINEICKIMKDNGMKFAYHNHDTEFEKFKGLCAIDRMFEECPDMDLILDLFWVQAGGASPALYLEKFKGRANIIHLKDYRIINRARQFAEIGEGNIDWGDIIPRCKKLGIPYAVIEQDGDYLSGPFESLALSREFLLKKGFWEQ